MGFFFHKVDPSTLCAESSAFAQLIFGASFIFQDPVLLYVAVRVHEFWWILAPKRRYENTFFPTSYYKKSQAHSKVERILQ